MDRLIRDGGYRGLDAEAVASAFAGLLEWLWQGVLSEGPRFVGGAQCPPDALEQLDRHLTFQRLQLLGDRRFGHVALARGRGEVRRVFCGEERPQQLEVHSSSIA